MARIIYVNGEPFEVINKRDRNALHRAISDHKANYSCKTIWDAYGRPSQTKVEIWKDWESWRPSNVTYFEVAGAGSHQFSIEGIYTDNNGKEGLIRITKGYNRIYM